MQKSYEYWAEMLERFCDYMASSPGASYKDVRNEGLVGVLGKFYQYNLNKAKKDIGIADEFIREGNCRISAGEWDQRKRDFLDFLKEHPESTIMSLRETCHRSAFNRFYDARINEAKKEAGISIEPGRRRRWLPEELGREREALFAYLRENPEIKFLDMEKNSQNILNRLYSHRINEAKIAAGIPEENTNKRGHPLPENVWQERKTAFLQYLKEHPHSTRREVERSCFSKTFDRFYNTRINEAKKEAGLAEEYLGKGIRECIPESVWQQRLSLLHEFLKAHPNTLRRDVTRELKSALDHFYNQNITKAKTDAGLSLEQITASRIQKPGRERQKQKQVITYGEFIEKVDALHDYLLEHPSATFQDLRENSYLHILRLAYSRKISLAKKVLGLSGERFKRRFRKGGPANKLSPEAWEKRRQEFIKYLRTHPQLTREKMLESGFGGVISKFYAGKIAPALIDAGLDQERISRFIIVYHINAAKISAVSFTRFRENRGLPSPDIEDMIQEGSLGILLAVKHGHRLSRVLALRASLFRMISTPGGVYQNSAVRLKSTRSFTQKQLDNAIITGEIVNEGIALAIKTLDPTNLEYRMLLEDFDEGETGLRTLDDALNNIAEKQDLTPDEGFPTRDSDISREAVDEVIASSRYWYLTEDDEQNTDKKLISEALDVTTLSEREKKILRLRYLQGGIRTHESIGEELNLTGGCIQQIEAKAIGKLQIPANSAKLKKSLGMDLSDEEKDLLESVKPVGPKVGYRKSFWKKFREKEPYIMQWLAEHPANYGDKLQAKRIPESGIEKLIQEARTLPQPVFQEKHGIANEEFIKSSAIIGIAMLHDTKMD